METPLNVIFIHPDLGVGGAERLVVDAALAIRSKGYRVSFVTNHHDPNHCFEETIDGTFPVVTVADWFPRTFFGKFSALCAYIRFIIAAIYVILCTIPVENPDIIFIDSISACIPFLRLFTSKKIIYYCHYPDMLLSKPGGILKKIYRAPLNFFEEFSIRLSHKVLVNSYFTAKTYKNTFKSLERNHPAVLYPSISTKLYNFDSLIKLEDIVSGMNTNVENATIFLSINRYEVKKNVALAIEALQSLELVLSDDDWKNVYLIIAGGYDPINKENSDCFDQLTKLTEKYQLTEKVKFLKTPSNNEKVSLLRHCNCLIYTPENEHFGIVPLEAMHCERPVLAVNSGGPTETVIHEVNGYLSEPTPESFAHFMSKIVIDKDNAVKMGKNGRKRFDEKFSFEAFQAKLLGILSDLCSD